jgi:hypothetical protein
MIDSPLLSLSLSLVPDQDFENIEEQFPEIDNMDADQG